MARRRRKVKRHRRRVVHRAKMTPARKKAVLAAYIKSHPGALAARLKARGGTLQAKTAKPATAHPAAHSTKKLSLKQHKKSTAHKKPKHKAKGAKTGVTGKKKKKKKKKAAGTWTLRHAAMSLGLLGLAAAGLFLVGSSVRPRKRRRARPARTPRPIA